MLPGGLPSTAPEGALHACPAPRAWAADGQSLLTTACIFAVKQNLDPALLVIRCDVALKSAILR